VDVRKPSERASRARSNPEGNRGGKKIEPYRAGIVASGALKNRQTSGEQMVKSITVCGGAKTFQKTAAAIYQKPGRD